MLDMLDNIHVKDDYYNIVKTKSSKTGTTTIHSSNGTNPNWTKFLMKMNKYKFFTALPKDLQEVLKTGDIP
ncbi:3037_t:CDS:2 [Entrophospora sp. SA101]|nr:3037_t:CDS:2 [Entrophospora sp. SA101]CAJ0921736.1 8000_t:CDS:2 [Entrophospora sp. SA101]